MDYFKCLKSFEILNLNLVIKNFKIKQMILKKIKNRIMKTLGSKFIRFSFLSYFNILVRVKKFS